MADVIHKLTLALLTWYDQHKRVMPWREQTPDPYKVWLVEVMSQQTTMGAVTPYFLKFVQHYPTVHDLAAAPDDEVMGHWAGLGYYSRARNLLKAARIISSHLSSRRRPGSSGEKSLAALDDFALGPGSRDAPTAHAVRDDMWEGLDWEALPGVGRYTAAAINTMAFGKPDVVVDGNVERITSRLYAVETPLPAAKKELYARAADIYAHHHDRPGALAQAFMDLGTAICRPRNPDCPVCPVSAFCKARSDTYPKRLEKTAKPERVATAYWIENGQGEVLFERRPDKGLLGGTVGLPCTDLKTGAAPDGITFLLSSQTSEAQPNADPGPSTKQPSKARPKPPLDPRLRGDDKVALGVVRHVFTHFGLTLTVERARAKNVDLTRYFWMNPEKVTGLSSLFAKALTRALPAAV